MIVNLRPLSCNKSHGLGLHHDGNATALRCQGSWWGLNTAHFQQPASDQFIWLLKCYRTPLCVHKACMQLNFRSVFHVHPWIGPVTAWVSIRETPAPPPWLGPTLAFSSEWLAFWWRALGMSVQGRPSEPHRDMATYQAISRWAWLIFKHGVLLPQWWHSGGVNHRDKWL